MDMKRSGLWKSVCSSGEAKANAAPPSSRRNASICRSITARLSARSLSEKAKAASEKTITEATARGAAQICGIDGRTRMFSSTKNAITKPGRDEAQRAGSVASPQASKAKSCPRIALEILERIRHDGGHERRAKLLRAIHRHSRLQRSGEPRPSCPPPCAGPGKRNGSMGDPLRRRRQPGRRARGDQAAQRH